MIQWMGRDAQLDPRPGGALPLRRQRAPHRLRLLPRGGILRDRVVFSFGWEREESIVEPGTSTVEVTLEPDGDATNGSPRPPRSAERGLAPARIARGGVTTSTASPSSPPAATPARIPGRTLTGRAPDRKPEHATKGASKMASAVTWFEVAGKDREGPEGLLLAAFRLEAERHGGDALHRCRGRRTEEFRAASARPRRSPRTRHLLRLGRATSRRPWRRPSRSGARPRWARWRSLPGSIAHFSDPEGHTVGFWQQAQADTSAPPPDTSASAGGSCHGMGRHHSLRSTAGAREWCPPIP